jgi:hypothetical protein
MSSDTPRTATKEWKWRRREVIIRDEYECQGSGCEAKGGPRGEATLHAHHLTPVSEGGSDDHGNLVTLCEECHLDTYAEHSSNAGHFDVEYTDDDFIEAIRELDGEATSSEVAGEIGCVRDSAYRRLSRLADEGMVKNRQAGRTILWSLPEDEP